jgi:leucine dehydrogenase
MDVFAELEHADAHRVLLLSDLPTGLRAIIALDDLTLGPGCGGIRTQPYANVGDALADVVKLSRAMTLKCAIANLPAGGAKTVVLDHSGMDRDAAFRRLGRYIQDLGGLYRCAGDLGTSLQDLQAVARETDFVNTTGARLGEATAITVVNGIRACVEATSGATLSAISVAVQGCGLIGAGVARRLAAMGARVVVADVDHTRANALAAEVGATVVEAESILYADVDVLAPCAIGSVITEVVARDMKAWAICGGANNQLAHAAIIDSLTARGILFVPDYLASSGAVIDGVSRDLGNVDPTPLLEATFLTATEILQRAKAEGRSTTDIAEALARGRIKAASKRGGGA